VRNIIDKIFNFYLTLKSRWRRFFNVHPRKRHRPNSVADLVFYDNFRSFDHENWIVGQPWGEYHPDALYQYYGKFENSIKSENDGLKLMQKYEPKSFLVDNTYTTVPYSVGLIVSKKAFGYGYFECDATLPKGLGLWPAIWLSDHLTWPPEIDILEAYSDDSGNYKDKLETNVHYGVVNVNKDSAKASKHALPQIKDSHRYAVLWTNKKIDFYYDGFLVRRITSKKVLKWFNKPNVKMNWILNNAIRPEMVSKIGQQVSEFTIHTVKVYSLKQTFCFC